MSKEKEEGRGKSAKKSKDTPKAKSSSRDEKIKFVIGVLIAGFALYLLLACIAYLFWWKTDLILRNADIISGPEIEVKNWSGKSGHFLAKMIIAKSEPHVSHWLMFFRFNDPVENLRRLGKMC